MDEVFHGNEKEDESGSEEEAYAGEEGDQKDRGEKNDPDGQKGHPVADCGEPEDHRNLDTESDTANTDTLHSVTLHTITLHTVTLHTRTEQYLDQPAEPQPQWRANAQTGERGDV